jgi:hypothetical protein
MIQPLPKVPVGQLSRLQQKQQRRAEETAALRACYAHADARDGDRCRVCTRRISTRALGQLEKTIHHHLVYRSRSSDPHRNENVVCICSICNEAIHTTGTLKLEGDADLRDAVTGRLAGIAVWRLKESGWEVTKWV